MNEEQQELLRDAEFQAAKHEAQLEYEAERAKRLKAIEDAECEHDEHEHGYCLDCGKDITDDLIGRAELLEDR